MNASTLSAAGGMTGALRRAKARAARARRDLDIALGVARGRLALRGAKLGGRVYVGGRVRLVSEGEVSIGHLALLFGGMLPTELICHAGATLAIGESSELNYGVSIEAHRRVVLGARCRVGSMVRIADSSAGRAGDVIIGDDVWIAHGAVIEPGVTLGDGAVVSAGSVVATSIPAGHLAIGNPARAVRLDVVGRGGSKEPPS